MMENSVSCVDNQHQYGLWNIDDKNNIAWRACEKCGYQENFIATDEYHQEVKKQKEAAVFLEAFQMVENTDEHMIGYLNVILDDYVSYLGKDSLNSLITKMESLGKADVLDMQNTAYVNYLHQYLRVNNIEAFLDTLEQFQEYNTSYLASILNNEESNVRHL